MLAADATTDVRADYKLKQEPKKEEAEKKRALGEVSSRTHQQFAHRLAVNTGSRGPWHYWGCAITHFLFTPQLSCKQKARFNCSESCGFFQPTFITLTQFMYILNFVSV